MDTYVPTAFPRQTHFTTEFALFCKDTFQGLLSGLLSIIGAFEVFNAETLYANVNTSLEAQITEGLTNGRLIGGIEILAAVLLFMSTTRSTARTLGVIMILVSIAIQNTGLTGEDLASGLSEYLRTIIEVFESV